MSLRLHSLQPTVFGAHTVDGSLDVLCPSNGHSVCLQTGILLLLQGSAYMPFSSLKCSSGHLTVVFYAGRLKITAKQLRIDVNLN
jgi:hypothetical protein